MNKIIVMSIFLITIPLLQMSSVSAWNWNTHQEIVESNYHSLPPDMQQNLNLELMKKGSNDPDFLFFDFKYHSYPTSYQKATYWLDKGQINYKNGNYYHASYCYGVASHYITDSFAAPHAASVSEPNHILYEARASFLKPEPVKVAGDLNSTIYRDDLNGEKDWNNWINSKNDSIIQNDLDQSTGASYNAMYSSLSEAYPIKQNKSEDDAKLRFLALLLNLI